MHKREDQFPYEREHEIGALSDALPGMVASFHLRADGSICMPYVSLRIWELFGLHPQDVVVDARPLLARSHPDDIRRVRESAVKSARTMTPWHEECRIVHPTRGERWIEGHSNPRTHPQGCVIWYGFVHDITERKQAQIAVRERQEFQQRVVKFAEVAPGALFTLRCNRDGQLSMPWAADKLVEVVGCWPEDARQDISALTACIHSGDVDTWHHAATVSAQTLLHWHCEFRLAHPIHGEVWIEWRANPARESQGSVLWHGFMYDVTERKSNEHQLMFMAHHDTLTGLPNRVLLTDRMQQAIVQSHRTGEFLAVLFIDLDGFKPVNDQYGHAAGDRILIAIGLRLTHMLRNGDTVARIGGDEFVVLLQGLSSVEECERSTQRLLKAIAEPVLVGEQSIMLSASIGIALYPDDTDDADSLLRRADEAMYTAKRTGRNQFVFFGNDAQRVSVLDGGMVHDLRLALELDQIDVHYQPIVDLATGRVHKAEALVRWKHPQKGYVPPVEFIPIAEESGLIHAIGNRVLQKAVQTTREWNGVCVDGVLRRISVNRSPREFYGYDGADDWISHMNTQGGCANMLSLEITEGLLLSDHPKVLAQLKQLRAMGMTVALDDFGTGYSSLSYLKKFDIDYIKIDRSFVLDIVDDPADRAIVESIIAMSRKLGIKLIAEGVETQAQAALLAAAHCDFAQGYLYARPMPQQEFLAFVRAAENTPLSVPVLFNHVNQD
ncbi:EAL domain-containing protein [Rhodoferax saidenbachensis]|uniref:Diguanylate cyclase (GGDEF)-like protein/PAS domain S-box-containing protein n=1 Tax=Rhodoferax saidenbachensis TaxID=1484693 RepID=A0ABU1ZSX8_9BURK|nr:EAL domain-containing protein [Rhodoferax saidenbachensis]MDR7308664.1 diguanylate cyclase (GGDEF)-like protein/PAS domain S-box-containing protein [Rhodoferax saidenbachensis]